MEAVADAAELETLSLEIERITEELNIALREGFLAAAITEAKKQGRF
jgi:hypothetical protein